MSIINRSNPNYIVSQQNEIRPVEKQAVIAPAQEALEQGIETPKKSLCERIFCVIKEGVEKIFKCFCCCFKKENVDIEAMEVGIQRNERENSDRAFLKAVQLMFEGERELDWDVFRAPLTEEQLLTQHRELKIALEKILPQSLNETTFYRDGMMDRTVTLLVQAIIKIKNPQRRLEIVQILLNKGADPRVKGFYYRETDPLAEARNAGDAQLVAILEQAINRMNG